MNVYQNTPRTPRTARRVASGLAVAALATGFSLMAAPAAQADTYGCTVDITSLQTSRDTDGHWVTAAAQVNCPSGMLEYTHIQLGITRNGEIMELIPGSTATYPGHPLDAYRDCPGEQVCTIYVSARAADPAATYTAYAAGWLQGPNRYGETVYAQSSIAG